MDVGNGMKTTLAVAQQMGLVRKTGEGQYQEVGPDPLKTIAEVKAEAQVAEEAIQAEHTIDLSDHADFKAFA